MKTKHTPGPWEVRGNWVWPLGKDDDIAHISGSYLRSGNEREANGQLIAAAPDLLTCCERALTESARVHPDFMAQLLAAIAKAKGEPT